MQDTEVYQQILGLESPWKVSKVDLDMDQGEIVARVSHPNAPNFAARKILRIGWEEPGDVPLIVKTVGGLSEKKYRIVSV